MKKLLFFLYLLPCINMFGTIRTVSNYPANLAQYNTIQAAVDAASNGDTIYVHGSPNQYSAFTITNKKLTIIGPGWAPTRGFMSFPATVYQMIMTGAGCNGSEIQGLCFVNSVTAFNDAITDIKFIRNQFKSSVYLSQGGATYSGFVFEGNWFDGGLINCTPSTTYTNMVIRNNLFHGTNTNGNIYGMSLAATVLIDHNLWYGPSANTMPAFGGSCKGLLITNNIFVRRDAAAQNSLSVFSNNITYNAVVNNPWAVNSNSDAGGNVENQDPLMVSQAAVNSGTNDPLLNFTIASGPANNSGSDGKDMGLLYDPSGSLNWANSRMSRIPYVYSMNITNPTINAGGTINVQVEARRSN